MQAGQLNILVLAYLGDSVLEVLVRDHLVLNRNIQKVNDLQKNAVAYVGAKGQAAFMKKHVNILQQCIAMIDMLFQKFMMKM